MSKIADLFMKYNCTNCQEDISGIRVHCAVCENFDLCLQCFAAGAEIGPHQNNHEYQFMDSGTAILSVYRGKGAWTAREEIRLLDAIEQYGFGNWEDISKHIETKSAEDAKEEYVNKFVMGTIGKHTWIPAQSQRPSLVDHTSEDSGPLGNASLQRLPPLDISSEEAAQLGYMPNRDSFEREYDPTAEQLISTLSLNTDDIEADYLLKLAQVDMYTRRLRERVRRKRLVRDYQLAANFFRQRNNSGQTNNNNQFSRENREFRDRFRVFAQFYTCNEYERLLDSLAREKDLRIRLSELCRYRYNGIKRFDECRHFEQHAAMASHRTTGPYGHGKTDPSPIIGDYQQPEYSLHSPHRNQIKTEQSNESEVSLSSIAPKSMHHTGDQISSGALLHNKNYLDNYQVSPSPMTSSMETATTLTRTMPTLVPTTNKKMQQQLVTRKLHPNHQSNNQSHHHDHHQKLQKTQTQPPPLLQLKHQNISATTATTTLQPHLKKEEPQMQQQQQQQQSPQKVPTNNNNNNNNVTIIINNNENYNLNREMSNILRTQIEELKRLKQPLSMDLLAANERNLCNQYKMSPTTYLSLKTLLLSNPPLASASLTPLENSVRKYFIQVGWLQHG